ncbi:hypothetical protein CRG98_022505 [Punica granatum]|uniref:Uncharacterized protein n=1 Tax=Punica granatum TaxID=22663 RepID=A0A2I0JLF7_PUNGR|nr:hypothetical protein CRG98_022505 [Punica granatum]
MITASIVATLDIGSGIVRPGQLTGPQPSGRKQVVVTPSHVRPSRVPRKVDTPKSRCIYARACVPRRDEIRAESCPDNKLGLVTVSLWVANLVHHFKWARDEARPVDLSEVLKLSCEMKSPLAAIAVPRILSA